MGDKKAKVNHGQTFSKVFSVKKSKQMEKKLEETIKEMKVVFLFNDETN